MPWNLQGLSVADYTISNESNVWERSEESELKLKTSVKGSTRCSHSTRCSLYVLRIIQPGRNSDKKNKNKIYQTNPTASSKPFIRTSIQLFERSRRRNEEGERRRMQVQEMIAKAKPSPPPLGMNHLQVFERSIRDANRNLMARFDIV